MAQPIGKVIGIWQGADGALAEMIYGRGDGHGGSLVWQTKQSKGSPKA